MIGTAATEFEADCKPTRSSRGRPSAAVALGVLAT